MNAKNYLQQIKMAEIKITQREQEYNELKSKADSIGGIEYGERVQTSPSADAIPSKVARYVDLESEIIEEIKNLKMLRHRIISEIHRLSDPRYVSILHKVYVEYKPINIAAKEMRYSYDRARHIHSTALKNFQVVILKKFEKK